MIGRLHHVVIACPDPADLAAFYSRLLGFPVTYRSPDWVVVAADDTTSGIAFQFAPDHRPPRWPDPNRPQQIHLDVWSTKSRRPTSRSFDWVRVV